MTTSQETLDQAAERLRKEYGVFISKDADVKGQIVIDSANAAFVSGVKEGAKWQAERMYSEKEVESLLHKFMQSQHPDWHGYSTTKWFEQHKKK